MNIKSSLLGFLIFTLIGQTAWAGRAPITTVATEPYASALVLDADTGEILFSRNADAPVYPASTLKLMVLLVILDRVKQGTLQLDEMVQITVEAYKMGGSQVYLDPKEQFSIEDLLYALMVQSANDAAVALAIHIAGSKETFVALMNNKAKDLGMKNTTFHSVHGLPPSRGQKVDVTTAEDFGILCRHLSTRPEVFKYTGTKVKEFRGGEFIMRTHNHLLDEVDGCDGFKTGYFTKAGFSIAATAKRNGVRIIAIVMGSQNRKVRDAKAIEMLNKGFANIPARPEAVIMAADATPVKRMELAIIPKEVSVTPVVPESKEIVSTEDSGWMKFFMGIGVGLLLYAISDFFRIKNRNRNNWRNRKL
ncbi:D-alanyl-D-alanine carboxypeptidase [Desulfotalea psychrophila]|uniref:D-alanyl-D-alanine carboxypeptidase n=1 Tax=Desulfotalea psychrophila TaxID=84980 RepID=A0ABS3AUR7_9BACT|nr:D-alanyl-D-alanine carboxypeptidase [Desulfocapsa sp.]MBN4068528.1 D-alanyl-D-alanine carboxypeptidase [Desulfotalea psychrophila]MBN4071659.1 D-alanyl-D-alanine carboxypeptidase [Desulfotalea psychrophila]